MRTETKDELIYRLEYSVKKQGEVITELQDQKAKLIAALRVLGASDKSRSAIAREAATECFHNAFDPVKLEQIILTALDKVYPK